MYWYCDLKGTLNATKNGSGCCLRDRESTDGGGYCLAYNNDSTVVVDTYWMVEADFVTAVENAEYVLPSAKKVTQTNDNLGFENFKCSTIVADDHFGCSKLQLWPAASYSGGFRFESEKRVEAYYYDLQQTGSVRWKKNRSFFLEGATGLVYSAVAGIATMLLAF